MISLTSPVRTRAHGWPAGVKLGLLCVATVMLFAADRLMLQFAALAGMVCLYALPGQVFFAHGMRRLRALWPFVLVLIAWHLVTNDLAAGLLITCRMLTAVGLANLVTMTTPLSGMMGVVGWLTRPLTWIGLPARAIELAIGLVIRFTPILAQKGQVLSLAWRARARSRAGWRVVVPLLVVALDDAEHVAEALRARGGVGQVRK